MLHLLVVTPAPDHDPSEILARAFPGSRVEAIWPLGGGVSNVTHAARLRGTEHEAVVVRQAGDAALARDPCCVQDEFRLLEAVRRAGIPAPEPIYLHSNARRATAMVQSFIAGVPALHVASEAALTEALAAELAAIHRVELREADLPFLGARHRRLESWLQETPEEPDAWLREAEIRTSVRQAGLPRTRNKPTLLHGDFWPGNLLWSGERVASVLDWEDALLGDPAFDVAIARLDLLWSYGEETVERFTADYAVRGVADLRDLPYWDLCAALRPMGAIETWATSWPRLGRPDVTLEQLRAGHRRFVDAALAAL